MDDNHMEDISPMDTEAPLPVHRKNLLERFAERFSNLTRHEKARRTLATFSLVMLVGIFTYIVYTNTVTSGPDYVFLTRSLNEPTKAAIDIRLTQTNDYFQIGLVLIGSIWGLIIAKKSEAALFFTDYPEIIMSSSAILLLGLSLWYHVLYVDTIAEIYSDTGVITSRMQSATADAGQQGEMILRAAPTDQNLTPIIADIFQENINYMFVAQQSFLFAGVVIALLTFVSVYKLKDP